MKKKIAVCANGWSPDVLSKAVEGFEAYARAADIDIYVFMCFASYSVHVTMMQGELNVYRLCDISEYDGIIVFSNLLNSDETAKALCMEAREKGVPVISVGMEFDGITSVKVDNEAGMKELIRHLIEEHDVKRIFYMGGTPDHVDSFDRLRVTREVMAEYGLELPDKNVAYGKWSNRRTVEALQEMLAAGGELPEAIVCANDMMALAVCTELEKRGINVPDDIKVTGFDDIANAEIFYPSLTTVTQDYAYVAKCACEMIYDEYATAKRLVVPTRAVIAESCGCRSLECEGRRRTYCRHSFQRNTDSNLLEQNERVMRSVLSDAADFREMKDRLRRHYLHNHQFEGSAFYIVINGEYLERVGATEKELCENGMPDMLDVLVAIKDGQSLPIDKVDKRQLIPGYEKKDGEQHIYYIAPLHYYDNNYGYVVFTDRPYVLNDSIMYPYLEKLQQSIRLLRANLRLKLIYDKDPMTGLFNRLGYENKAFPLYQESLRSGSPMSVMFIDINSMKAINDGFGHEQGDTAIRLVAAAISERISEDWVAVRYGGDEFLVIIPDCDEELAVWVKHDIMEILKKNCAEKALPYTLSISIGFVTTDPKKRPDASLKEYVREADALMYNIKKEMHKNMR